MNKVLVTDPLSENGLDILKHAGGDIAVDVKTGLSAQELRECIGEYNALIIRSGTKVTADIIENADRLKVIGRAGTGVDNVDIESATKRGIIVMNTPGGNTISTAEHTFTLILALVRNVGPAYMSMRNKKWDRKKFKGRELFGKTLGIIGLGRIGAEISRRAIAFGMKVAAYDPFLSAEKAEELGVEPLSLDKLYAVSDIITVHTPLTKETKGIIGRDAFSRMKKGVFIINCARGGIVDESALLESIKSGKAAGAALDVFEKEPPSGSPLLGLDSVLVTPHLGASTEEAQEKVAVDVAHQVVDALRGGHIRNALNAPSVDAESLKLLRPYLVLGEKLGLMLAQLVPGRVEELHIRYNGDIARFNVGPVTVAVLKGALGHAMEEPVNDVNAPVIAKERGIKVVETKSSAAEDFTDLIYVKAVSDAEGKNEFSAAGTVFGKRKAPRIVRINNYRVEAVPAGYVLFLINKDMPGMIGNVGVILGRNNINIAGMALGRDTAGGKALTMLNVDALVPDEVLKEIKCSPGIIDIKMIKL